MGDEWVTGDGCRCVRVIPGCVEIRKCVFGCVGVFLDVF